MLPPKKGVRKWIPAITACAVPTVFNKDHYTKILKSGGWSYNHYDESKMTGYLKAESAAGICCLCKKEDFLAINFREDKWLEDTDYALYDDQVMFYKFHLQGFNIFCVTEAQFTHLDAGSSSPERAVKAAFANSRNKVIFWYLYILKMQKNAWVKSGSSWCYVGGDGVMVTGWLTLSGSTYWFDSSGRMATGWRQIRGKYYYFMSSGVMARNKWVGDYWLKDDGTMAVNEWVDGGKYYVGFNGAWVKGKTR
jgi:glucan-binding YG repeat protein